MPLQSSGPISLANIQTEFGGSAATSLSEYYAGGPYVPNPPPLSASQSATIPASGPIRLSMFYGTSAASLVPLNNQSVSDNRIVGGSTASVNFFQNGVLSFTGNNNGAGPHPDEEWYSPITSGVGTGYWIRAIHQAGQIPSGSATGVWLQLFTTRIWSSFIPTGIGSISTTLQIQIASDSTGSNILSSANYYISTTHG